MYVGVFDFMGTFAFRATTINKVPMSLFQKIAFSAIVLKVTAL